MLRARGQSQARIDCQLFKNRVVFLQLVHESLPAKSDIKRMKPRGAVFPAIGEKQASKQQCCNAPAFASKIRPSYGRHFAQSPDGLITSTLLYICALGYDYIWYMVILICSP
jgi:hypothetical protein